MSAKAPTTKHQTGIGSHMVEFLDNYRQNSLVKAQQEADWHLKFDALNGWLVFKFGYGNLLSVTEPKAKSSEHVTVGQLLCDVPLHKPCIISALFSSPQQGSVGLPEEIRVHCDHEKCG